MDKTIVKDKMTFKRILRGMFQWQVLLVASAFLAFFVFITYICCNICAPYVFEDLKSTVYRSFESTMLVFFLIGSAISLSIALFSAFMVDHPTFFKDIASKMKKVDRTDKAVVKGATTQNCADASAVEKNAKK